MQIVDENQVNKDGKDLEVKNQSGSGNLRANILNGTKVVMHPGLPPDTIMLVCGSKAFETMKQQAGDKLKAPTKSESVIVPASSPQGMSAMKKFSTVLGRKGKR